MPHTTSGVYSIDIDGATANARHFNYAGSVGVAQGYKVSVFGNGYKAEVVTCQGWNCPTDGSAWVYSRYVWVQATGDFLIVQSNHKTVLGSSVSTACRSAV